MFVRIDQALDVPLYQQLRNEIVRGIAQEELAPGDALPSVRNLASDLGINLHTVNKAYALLRDEGYVEMKGRKGAFVAQPAVGKAAAVPGYPSACVGLQGFRRHARSFRTAGKSPVG